MFVFLFQTYICLVVDINLTLLVKLIAANVQHEYVFTSRYAAPLQGNAGTLHCIGAGNLLDQLIYQGRSFTVHAPT